MNKGKVYLIGAGPGDIGLFTIKGVKCLKKADVVVYDFHINSQILNYLDRKAEFIYAGKRGGRHAMTQDEINSVIVEKAKEGKVVCRLKGGDPFVFGRGGEEAEVLFHAGIDFEIVPGVSSAVSAPAYAGIPLTHRKCSSSFAVITGNEDVTKKESTLNWDGFANNFDTLVFLMGVKNIDFIAKKLIEHGRPPNTPVAVIRWGTRPDQITVVGELSDISDKIKEINIAPPAVMVIGETVKLRDTLKWYEKKPLFGHRILITRRMSEEYEKLVELGAEIFECPTVQAVAPEDYNELDKAIKDMSSYDWLIFTSVNGVKFFIDRIIEANFDIRDLKGVKICTIGKKTAETVRKYGLKVDITPKKFNAEGLVELFREKYTAGDGLKGVRFLLPRADIARDLFPQQVRDLGGEIDTITTYRSINPILHNKRLKRFIHEGKITVATFTSAATFDNLIDIIGENSQEFLRSLKIAAIGPVTKKAIEKAGLKIDIMPETATIEAMVDAIIDEILAKKI
ncbi:MAG: uroporphyrinogen-III C-methyltransferase [Nitrospirae bacterium]|nr:uroporphyrinogen-III C-methyltransferase [Nitrospirota bacterium]